MSGLKAPQGMPSNRVAQPNIEPGSYPARVVSVVDLGVQPQRPYKGEAKPPCQMIRVTYELTDVFMLDEDGNELEDKPRWIAEEFKLLPLAADLAVSTKRYKVLDPTLEHDGDWSLVLGFPVNVAIVNNEGKDGKTYDNPAGTSVMRKKDQDNLEELKNDPFFFSTVEPDPAIWKKIPEWLQDKIKGNINYEGSALQEMVNGAPAAPAAKKEAPKKVAKKVVEAEPEAGEPAEGDDIPW